MDAQEYLNRFDVDQTVGDFGVMPAEDVLYSLLHQATDPTQARLETFVETASAVYTQITGKEADVLKARREDLQLAKGFNTARASRKEVAVDRVRMTAEYSNLDYTECTNGLHDLASDYSKLFLSKVLAETSPEGLIDPRFAGEGASRIVNEILGHHSANMAKMAEGHTVTINYHSTVDRQKFQLEEIDTSTMTVRHRFNEVGVDEDSPELEFQERVATMLLEVDALVSLVEWVRSRRVPYLPIFAPKTAERGNQQEGRNAHSDILLVGIGNADIVPVKVRLKHDGHLAGDYIEDMVFLTDSIIATQSRETQTVVDDESGKVKTVISGTSVLGDITESWIKTHSARKNQKARMKKVLGKKLEPVFEKYDAVVLPRLSL